MQAAGNFNALQQAREQGFYSEAYLNLTQANQAKTSSREHLLKLLGLAGKSASVNLQARLPDLPATISSSQQIEQQAMTGRLDLQIAQLRAEQLAKNLGLTRSTRFINVLELGGVHNTLDDQSTQRGYQINLELPLFDWGDAKVAYAQASYMQALSGTAAVANAALSEVQQAYLAYQSAYDTAKHYRDEIVPLQQKIAHENLLRYNGMLIGVFDLLTDTRAQISSVNGAIRASRDFWIAKADLDMSLLGKPTLSGIEERAEAKAVNVTH